MKKIILSILFSLQICTADAAERLALIIDSDERISNLGGKCVRCYKESTPTRHVGCTNCPKNSVPNLFLELRNPKVDMNLIRDFQLRPPLAVPDILVPLNNIPELQLLPVLPAYQLPFRLQQMIFPPLAFIFVPNNDEANENG